MPWVSLGSNAAAETSLDGVKFSPKKSYLGWVFLPVVRCLQGGEGQGGAGLSYTLELLVPHKFRQLVHVIAEGGRGPHAVRNAFDVVLVGNTA